jgi:ribosomal protein S13
MSTVPDKNIMIIENSREIRSNYRFFRHNSYFTIHGQRQYSSANSKKEEDSSAMSFATIANRPPV